MRISRIESGNRKRAQNDSDDDDRERERACQTIREVEGEKKKKLERKARELTRALYLMTGGNDVGTFRHPPQYTSKAFLF